MTAHDTSTEAVTALLEGVTPGPWRIHNCESMGHRATNYYQEIWNDETDILVTTEVTRAHNDGGAANMRFIAAARELVPALLAERDAAHARAERAEDSLRINVAVCTWPSCKHTAKGQCHSHNGETP